MSRAILGRTVGEMVVAKPARARLFEKLGIDYCCGGKKPLEEACGDKGIDPALVQAALEALDEQAAPPEEDWAAASMTALADHIEATHHAYLKNELPRLESLLDKIARVHGERHPEMVQVAAVFKGLQAEMFSHMAKEEQILFPMCRQLERQDGPARFHCGSIGNPIRVMVMEHEDAGNALERMRTLTGNYAPPADACNTFRAAVDGLRQLENDMHQHVHKENNILFPKAIAAEAQSMNH